MSVVSFKVSDKVRRLGAIGGVASRPAIASAAPALLLDTFTNVAETLLTAHTPDISPDGLPWERKRQTVSAQGQWRVSAAGRAYLPIANWTVSRLIYTKDVGVSNVRISARLRLNALESDTAGGLDVRATDANNRFFAVVQQGGATATLRISSVTSGTSTVIASLATGVSLYARSLANDGLDASFEANGNDLIFRVDEFTLATTSALRLTVTHIGLGGDTGQGNQTLDDIIGVGL